MKKEVVNTTISSQFFFKLLISAIRYPNAMKAPGANTNIQHTVFFRKNGKVEHLTRS